MITKLQVKYIQSLRQKKFRDEEGVFVAEGPKIINELLAEHSGILVSLYVTETWLKTHAALIKAIPQDKVISVKDDDLERISFLQTPNEVLGVFKKPEAVQPVFTQTLSLMLDGIQDPGNMGTLIRIADWFGVHNIVCSLDCADAFAPKVVQSTMGSIMRVRLSYTDLLQTAGGLKNIPLYAATLHGEIVNEMSPVKEGIIVIGNESKGIHPALLEFCKKRITIPRIGHAESLNAAVAAGIILSRLAMPR